jgi:hypothetical protein
MLLEVIIAIFLSLLLLANILGPLTLIIKSSNQLKDVSEDKSISCQSIKTRNNLLLEKCSDTDTKEFLRLRNKQSGFSIFEIVIASFLAMLIVAVSSRTFAQFISVGRKVESQILLRTAALRISSEIERIFRFSDSHPLPIAAVLHQNGQIKLKDSELNRVHYGNPKLRPKADSVAITNVNLAVHEILDIQNCNKVGNLYEGEACLRFTNSLSDYSSFLLLSLDGLQEAVGEVSGRTNCRKFSVNTAKSMLFEIITSQSKCNLISIVPIKAIQTLYLSETGDFRLIGHRHDQNIENQPVTNPHPELKISLNQLALDLELNISAMNRPIISQRLNRHVTAVSYFNLLLNK